MDDVLVNLGTIDGLLEAMTRCPYSAAEFGALSDQIQSVVDNMQSKGLTNVAVWVRDVDCKVEAVLTRRCKDAIEMWERSFLTSSDDVESAAGGAGAVDMPHPANSHTNAHTNTNNACAADRSHDEETPQQLFPMEQTVHEILLSNQILYLSPPLEQARVDWIRSYKQFLSVVTSLPRLVLSRYAVFASNPEADARSYADILTKIDPALLIKPYKAIEKKLTEARVCVQHWLQYQALWDSSVSEICDRLGMKYVCVCCCSVCVLYQLLRDR